MTTSHDTFPEYDPLHLKDFHTAPFDLYQFTTDATEWPKFVKTGIDEGRMADPEAAEVMAYASVEAQEARLSYLATHPIDHFSAIVLEDWRTMSAEDKDEYSNHGALTETEAIDETARIIMEFEIGSFISYYERTADRLAFMALKNYKRQVSNNRDKLQPTAAEARRAEEAGWAARASEVTIRRIAPEAQS